MSATPNWEAARAEFPIPAHNVFLNTCWRGAPRQRARAATAHHLDRWAEHGAAWIWRGECAALRASSLAIRQRPPITSPLLDVPITPWQWQATPRLKRIIAGNRPGYVRGSPYFSTTEAENARVVVALRTICG